MNYFLQHILLLSLFIFFTISCSISELSQQAKDGITSSKTYLSEKSKKAYEEGKNKLGLSNEKQVEVKPMTVAKFPFGKMPDGKKVSQFILTNANKMQVTLLDYGATVKDIIVPDRDGNFANVSLGFSNLMIIVKKVLISVVLPVGMLTELPGVSLA